MINQTKKTECMQNFEKKHRLLVPADFQAVFNQPIKKVHSEHLLAFVATGAGSTARLGLAITKKKLKRAVDRNRIKRLIRESFRHNYADINLVDIVVIVKISYDKEFDIGKEVGELFRKIKQLYSK